MFQFLNRIAAKEYEMFQILKEKRLELILIFVLAKRNSQTLVSPNSSSSFKESSQVAK
jgi:hypothetical protein